MRQVSTNGDPGTGFEFSPRIFIPSRLRSRFPSRERERERTRFFLPRPRLVVVVVVSLSFIIILFILSLLSELVLGAFSSRQTSRICEAASAFVDANQAGAEKTDKSFKLSHCLRARFKMCQMERFSK